MAKRINTKKANYKISLDKLEILIKKMKDLTKLDKSIYLKLTNNTILLYSIVGQGVNIHSFKSHTQNIKDTFNVIKDEIEDELIYKIDDGKRFTNSISMFIKYMRSQEIFDDIVFQLSYFPETGICEKLLIKNSKSKEETPGKKPTNNQDIDADQIDDLMDTELTKFSFNLKEEDYKYIKSKSGIEKDNDVLYMNIKDNLLSIGENRWDFNICNINEEDETISFPKKYFNCINYEVDKNMVIYVAETYLLILGETSNLLISVEFSI
jgi:hypothetical protein